MKLKYQMRGLGIGMIVTALLMGVTEKGLPLSDAEIRAKALELGMVESDSLKLTDIDVQSISVTPTATPSSAAESTPESSEPVSEPSEDGETGEGSAEKSQVEENGTENTPVEDGSEQNISENSAPGSETESTDTVTVAIEAGVTSYRICIMLEELGLVEDAAEFDTYLCDNGYSRKIDYGTYEIPLGASEEEIAKIITRNR